MSNYLTSEEDAMIIVKNIALDRAMVVTYLESIKYREFLLGWSSAEKRITREETFDLVDKYKEMGLEYFNRDVGVLYGRVMSYQGLIYLNQEIPLPKELWSSLSMQYS